MALLSGMAAALAGLAAPSAMKSLGMTNAEAADPLLVGALHGVSKRAKASHDDVRHFVLAMVQYEFSESIVLRACAHVVRVFHLSVYLCISPAAHSSFLPSAVVRIRITPGQRRQGRCCRSTPCERWAGTTRICSRCCSAEESTP